MALLALLLLRAPGPLTLSIGALRRPLEPELRSRTQTQHLVRAADGSIGGAWHLHD